MQHIDMRYVLQKGGQKGMGYIKIIDLSCSFMDKPNIEQDFFVNCLLFSALNVSNLF